MNTPDLTPLEAEAIHAFKLAQLEHNLRAAGYAPAEDGKWYPAGMRHPPLRPPVVPERRALAHWIMSHVLFCAAAFGCGGLVALSRCCPCL